VLHPGSHRGVDTRSATRRIAARIVEALEDAAAASGALCDVYLENTAGAGGTVGRSFEELAEIISEAGHDERIGICIDTQHLWASGVRYETAAEADAVIGSLAAAVGMARVRCLHLNDSKVPFGSNRDRHENLGKGTIGARPLRALLGHPDLQDLPAILEVPGESGIGPGAADLRTARALHATGMATRRRRLARSRCP
jgi:deoxyribonuclease-4